MYLVYYSKRDYEGREIDYPLFVTLSEKKAQDYSFRLNSLVNKYRKYYTFAGIRNDRWRSLMNFVMCYYIEIEVR